MKSCRLHIFLITLLCGTVLVLSAQEPQFRLPAYVRNASKDINVNKESTLQFSILKNGSIFFKEKPLTENLQNSFKTHFQNPGFLKYVYIKSDVETKSAELLKLVNTLPHSEIYEIRLVVIPYKLVFIPSENVQETLEKRAEGYTLNLRLINKEIEKKEASSRNWVSEDYDEPNLPAKTGKVQNPSKSKTLPKKILKTMLLFIERKSYSDFRLNGQEVSEKTLLTAIKNEFQKRTANKFYRPGTNQIDKSVSIKISPQLEYKYLISLVDSLYGLGADSVYLRINDIKR